jgi:acetoin utilization protein AcuB
MSLFHVPVEEYTTPNPITCPVETNIDEIQKLMKTHGVRHLPVTQGKAIVGILSDRDVRVALGLSSKEKFLVTARDIMIPEPFTVDSQDTLESVAFLMSEKKIGSVLVMEAQEFLGIFTVTDALNALIEVSRGEA